MKLHGGVLYMMMCTDDFFSICICLMFCGAKLMKLRRDNGNECNKQQLALHNSRMV